MKLSEMLDFEFKLHHLIIPYAIMVVLTFGHAANNFGRKRREKNET